MRHRKFDIYFSKVCLSPTSKRHTSSLGMFVVATPTSVTGPLTAEQYNGATLSLSLVSVSMMPCIYDAVYI